MYPQLLEPQESCDIHFKVYVSVLRTSTTPYSKLADLTAIRFILSTGIHSDYFPFIWIHLNSFPFTELCISWHAGDICVIEPTENLAKIKKCTFSTLFHFFCPKPMSWGLLLSQGFVHFNTLCFNTHAERSSSESYYRIKFFQYIQCDPW